ncbi:MAG TPA: aminotransferase class V-fold PLP-dependent enzyme, partial [Polyangiaceae bacterium]|nr:aminotransferase class V-fold PLP-dependent enzyme [Polyangiaceae bacterium]
MSSTSLPEIPLAPLSRPGVPEPRLGERASFPELEWRAFLGHAAISPASAAVREAVRACVEDTMRGGAAAFLPWELQRRRLRRGLEQWLGAQEGEVALTSGTTRGLTDLALALPLREGDVIVTYAGEFPANVT